SDPACVADLAITQSLAATMKVGDVATLTLTASNAGPATAHNVVVSDTLPASLSLVDVPPGCTLAAPKVSCVVDVLASGASASIPLSLRAVAIGDFTNTATVAAEEFDVVATNNASSLSSTVRTDATLLNLSTRGLVLTGSDVMIGGFVIGGATPKTVVVTAIGPSLVAAGIPNALPDPVLTLVRSSDGAIIAGNDDWRAASNAAGIQAAGLAPAHDREAAIMMTLPPGAYTAIVSGAGGTAGVGIVAVYEVDHRESPLVNISTRGEVLTGSDVVIGGFIVQGTAPQTVVVTGTGPSLIAAGIPNALANPVLTLVRSSDGVVIAANDDWGASPDAIRIRDAGFAPANASESAIMATLPPGAYTAILSGAGNTTGVGIVAVYAVP
ncbi:MAG TPA: DUF11 domain-containing protein, partial [Usitatibacter sp.]|nr:DUF11 domain-containing protein [Usitatibacter sp.]